MAAGAPLEHARRGHPSPRASPWPTSTRRSIATAASSAPSSSIARRSPTRASRPRRCASATGRVELLASLGPDTPVGKFLAKRGPGMHHVAFEVDDVGAELERLAGGRRRADRRARRAAGSSGSRWRSSTPMRPAACSRSWWAVASDRVRLDIVFEGGASLTVTVPASTADELDRALANAPRWTRSASRPTTAATRSSMRKIVFVRRSAREQVVGFGARRSRGQRLAAARSEGSVRAVPELATKAERRRSACGSSSTSPSGAIATRSRSCT